MKVDVFTPEDHVGDVIGDLNEERGMIKDQEAGTTGVKLTDVPLAEMFGYIGHLRTMTSGRGQFPMELALFPCPQNVADDVIAASKNSRINKFQNQKIRSNAKGRYYLMKFIYHRVFDMVRRCFIFSNSIVKNGTTLSS